MDPTASASISRARRGSGRLLAGAMALACALPLLGACGKAEAPETRVAAFDVPAEELGRLVSSLTRPGANKMIMPRPWVTPGFEMLPERGPHRVKWSVSGQVPSSGALKTVLEATLGEDADDGVRLACRIIERQADAGVFTQECESPPFRVKEKKALVLGVTLEQVEGFIPTQVKLQVIAGTPTLKWKDWMSGSPFMRGTMAMLVLFVLFGIGVRALRRA
jgi:hypothetical protein